jgi:hypothetical protein
MADLCVGDGDEACCAWCGGMTGTAGRLWPGCGGAGGCAVSATGAGFGKYS